MQNEDELFDRSADSNDIGLIRSGVDDFRRNKSKGNRRIDNGDKLGTDKVVIHTLRIMENNKE